MQTHTHLIYEVKIDTGHWHRRIILSFVCLLLMFIVRLFSLVTHTKYISLFVLPMSHAPMMVSIDNLFSSFFLFLCYCSLLCFFRFQVKSVTKRLKRLRLDRKSVCAVARVCPRNVLIISNLYAWPLLLLFQCCSIYFSAFNKAIHLFELLPAGSVVMSEKNKSPSISSRKL